MPKLFSTNQNKKGCLYLQTFETNAVYTRHVYGRHCTENVTQYNRNVNLP